MWWEPTNDYERVLADDVRSVRGWLFESIDSPQLGCFGAGSIWSPYFGALAPVLLLTRLPPEFFSTLADNIWPLKKTWLYSAGSATESRRFPFPSTRIPLHLAVLNRPTATARAVAGEMSVATQRTTDRIMDAFVRVREPIACASTGKRGAAGVFAFHESEPVLLTAGHIANKGTMIVQHRSRWPYPNWFSKTELLGSVMKQIAPSADHAPNWDVAVIRPSDQHRVNFGRRPTAPLVSKLYTRFQAPERIRVHGAFSGMIGRAVVQGALTDLGEWKNCWMVAPSGLLRDGDSGTPVFVERDGSFLGMYVAKSEFRGTRLPLFHYVQDACSLEREVLKDWNISFNIRA